LQCYEIQIVQQRFRTATPVRLRQLERIHADRYGRKLPDDDAGRDELNIAAMHIADGGLPEQHIPAWASLWAP
jgi:hypothetical protein